MIWHDAPCPKPISGLIECKQSIFNEFAYFRLTKPTGTDAFI